MGFFSNLFKKKCFFHPSYFAVSKCEKCGKKICSACGIKIESKGTTINIITCKDCKNEIINMMKNPPKIKNGTTMQEVVKILGKPYASNSGAELMGNFNNVMGNIGTLANRQFCSFKYLTGDYSIIFENGLVHQISFSPKPIENVTESKIYIQDKS